MKDMSNGVFQELLLTEYFADYLKYLEEEAKKIKKAKKGHVDYERVIRTKEDFKFYEEASLKWLKVFREYAESHPEKIQELFSEEKLVLKPLAEDFVSDLNESKPSLLDQIKKARQKAIKVLKDPRGKGGAGLFFLLACLLYTSPSPRDRQKSRMPSSA